MPGLMPFAAGLGLVALHTLFYLTLVIMLGTFVNARGTVVAIALGLLFGQQLAGNVLGPLSMYLPGALGSLAAAASLGQPLPSYAAIAITSVLSVGFVVAALWRFEREEL